MSYEVKPWTSTAQTINGVTIQMFLDPTIAQKTESRFPWFRVETTLKGKVGVRLFSSRKAMFNYWKKLKTSLNSGAPLAFGEKTKKDTIRYNEALSEIATEGRTSTKAAKQTAKTAAKSVLV